MPTELDYARMAAYIDGEGCIRISRGHKGRFALRLVIVNTDPRLLIWAKNLFGGSVAPMYMPPGRIGVDMQRFFWEVSGTTAARLLDACYPFFIMKREETDIALTFQATKTSTWGSGRSTKKGVPPEVVEQRQQLANKLTVMKRTRPTLQEASLLAMGG
jgi:hypothetical protein